MDYKSNEHFFDVKYNKKTSMIFVPGAIAAGIGGFLIAGSYIIGGFFWMLSNILGWPLLIAGVVLLCVAFSRMVKESEVTGETDELIKALKDECIEKLEYPSDADSKAIVFAGCHITNDNIDTARKLKSGNYINENLILSFFYEKNGVVNITQRTVSLVKEGYTDVEKKLSFDDFDNVAVETDTLKNEVKINFVRFYKDGKVIFETPLVDNDYYKEEYFNSIMHDKERLSKRQ